MTHAIAERTGAAQLRPRGVAGRGLMDMLRHHQAVRRTRRELDRLDDRLLADIGLTRGDVPGAAWRVVFGQVDAPVGAPVDAPVRGRSALAKLAERLYRARARASMIRDLRRLPDNILVDIGIERSMIQKTVDAVLANHDRQPRPVAPARRTGSPVHELLHGLDAAIRPLRHWNMSRIAAGQFARLDGQTMADLGYVKGDVDWVPDAMAERRLSTAANRNQARRGVA